MSAPTPRFFVGILAYHWETKDKRFYPYDESCPILELAAEGYRLYRFKADLPWHALCPPSGLEMEVSPFEEDLTKDPLPEGQSLAAYVYGALSRIVHRLLPGRIFAPWGSVDTQFDESSRTIHISTRYGAVTLQVK